MENITHFYFRHLRYIQAKDDSTATVYDKYMALSYAIRSQMVDKWIDTQKKYHEENPRRVYFLSMEYVFGKSLKYNIINLGIEKSVIEAAENLGFSLDELAEVEDDFDLGNANIGRLSASLLDSMATLALPSMAYGLHYDYAEFQQRIEGGMQREEPNDWLHTGHPWEIRRPEYACKVSFGGKIKPLVEGVFPKNYEWNPADDVIAVPHDFPVPGYGNDTVNTLRLWSAQATEKFLPDYINHRDYVRACEEKFQSGRITNYLIPDEDIHRATEKRIKQQFMFVSASLQDIIRRYKQHNTDMRLIDKKVVVQLNGSKCAIAIAEFMRLLVDVEHIAWDDAWKITRNVFAYTSHAVSFDNLEKWPVYLIQEILPRHTQIIFDINEEHLSRLRKTKKYSDAIIRELSIVEEGEVKWIRMSHLAVLGSFCINGVSNVHTETLKTKIFQNFAGVIPDTIINITNGIELRRWLLHTNKPLANLISECIGEKWITDYKAIKEFENFKDDAEVIAHFGDIKHAAKRHLQSFLEKNHNISIDADTFFDIQCTKIHSYKRQTLHVLYILAQYLKIKQGGDVASQRTHIFGGKASPTDFLAKQIIHLIHIIAEIINNDPLTKNKLKVIFVPNYGLSLAERIIPAADLSEQLAAPGYEACGISNMKFAINGAHIIASPGGSNIELIDSLQSASIIVFGNGTQEHKGADHKRNPYEILDANAELKTIFNFLDATLPSYPDGNLVYPLLYSLRDTDALGVIQDYDDYTKKQNHVDELYKNRSSWFSRCICNIARSGWLSSDRVVEEYSRKIWKLM